MRMRQPLVLTQLTQETHAKVNKGAKITFLLLLVLPAMELWQLFPSRKYHFYPLNPQATEWLTWYVKDLVTKLFLFGISFWFYQRERSRADGYPQLTVLLPLYFGMDFLVYPFNKSAPGALYLIVYGPILLYVAYTTFKTQIWQALEYIYGVICRIPKPLKRKRKGNGNDRRSS